MNYYLGLILLSACISVSWADDFSLSFSREIIEAAERQPDDLDDLSLPLPKPDDPVPLPLRQDKTNQPHASESEKTGNVQEPAVQRTRSVSRVFSAHSKSLEPVNKFLPVQDVPPNHFFGREIFADKASLENDYRHADGQNQMGIDPFELLRDEMRLTVGEDIYAKMVWTYLDAKQLDNWINTTIDQSELFAQDSLIVGLNNQLMASLTSLGLARSNGRNYLLEESLRTTRQGERQANELNGAKQIVNDALMKAEFERQSYFFGVLKYLTVGNFLYLLLSIMILAYFVKLIKFLIRQQ
ncbi:MAG: hypothetical protein M0R33_06185 [Methylomonas sp.]|jgi:hypothetical protein|uniref:hypothetical protein n=1 Tax=Methylomonas sp. TaxID=418 RepID=UPI0025CDF839|nr:hypothetical protein [Methylomonas sp.]MCK9606025.1 hypothetical protein [Methylomonas sp.]